MRADRILGASEHFRASLSRKEMSGRESRRVTSVFLAVRDDHHPIYSMVQASRGTAVFDGDSSNPPSVICTLAPG
jgi:hypothetical protein